MSISRRVLSVLGMRAWLKKDFCERMGIPDTLFTRYMRPLDRGTSSIRTLLDIAGVIGVDPAWLLTGRGDMGFVESMPDTLDGEPETQKTGEAVVASPPSLPRSPVSDAAIADGVAALQRTAPVRKRRA